MIRIVGCLMIVGATTLAGIERAEREKKQQKEMLYLQKIIYRIQSEIRYSRQYLPEIFLQIGRTLKAPFCVWLLEMNEQLTDYKGGTFEVIWKESVEQNLRSLKLPLSELESLKSLGNELGTADVQAQMKVLDLYQEHLGNTIVEHRKEMGGKIRLYRSLGIMSGILISIILL